MSDTTQLRDMLDNIINNKAEDAQVNFHSYLHGKMQQVLGTAQPEESATKQTNDKE